MLEFLQAVSNPVGVIGVIFVLAGYFLINTNRLNSTSKVYLSLNFVGAWLILFSLFFHWNLSSVIIELAWITISGIGFYRLMRAKRTAS
jgi:surface polysaccharide O-acyltransferase-like enzyme